MLKDVEFVDLIRLFSSLSQSDRVNLDLREICLDDCLR